MEPGRFEPTDWREWRRLRAWHLEQAGWNQGQIAVALGAREGTVSRWLTRARRDGPRALLAQPIPGRPPKLEPEQARLIPDFLAHGAEAYGFRDEVWTCARVAQVIEEEFSVSYHKSQVSRLLCVAKVIDVKSRHSSLNTTGISRDPAWLYSVVASAVATCELCRMGGRLRLGVRS